MSCSFIVSRLNYNKLYVKISYIHAHGCFTLPLRRLSNFKYCSEKNVSCAVERPDLHIVRPQMSDVQSFAKQT